MQEATGAGRNMAFQSHIHEGGGTPPLLSGHFPFDPYPAACAFIDAEGERSLKVVIDLQDMAR